MQHVPDRQTQSELLIIIFEWNLENGPSYSFTKNFHPKQNNRTLKSKCCWIVGKWRRETAKVHVALENSAMTKNTETL